MQVTLTNKPHASQILPKNKKVIIDRLYNNNKNKYAVKQSNPQQSHHHNGQQHAKLRITNRIQQRQKQKQNIGAVSTKPSICQSQQQSLLLSCIHNDSTLANENSKAVTPFTLSMCQNNSTALQNYTKTEFDRFWDQHTVKYKRINISSDINNDTRINRNLLKQLYAAQAHAQNRQKQAKYKKVKNQVQKFDDYHLAGTAHFGMNHIDINNTYQQQQQQQYQSSASIANQQKQRRQTLSQYQLKHRRQYINKQNTDQNYKRPVNQIKSYNPNSIINVGRSKTQTSLYKQQNIPQIQARSQKQPKLQLNISKHNNNNINNSRYEHEGRVYHQGNTFRYLRPIPRAHTQRCRQIQQHSIRQSGSIRRQNSTSNLLQMQEQSSQKLKHIREQLHQIYRGLTPNAHPSGYNLQMRNQIKPISNINVLNKNNNISHNNMGNINKNDRQIRMAQGSYHIRKGLQVCRPGAQHHYSHRLLLSRSKLHV